MEDTLDKNKLYVGNLPFKTTEEDLFQKFEKFEVEEGKQDLKSGPRGLEFLDPKDFEIYVLCLDLNLISLRISYFT